MCYRNRTPGQDLDEHEHAACHWLPTGRREVSLPSWKEENTAYKHHLSGRNMQIRSMLRKWHCRKTKRVTAGDDPPLKYLSDDQEAEGDGYSSPEVLCFRENNAIVVLQICPAVAFRKPNPVRPYQLTQPRQHPKRQNRGRKGFVFFVSCGRKLRQVMKKTFCLLGQSPFRFSIR